MKRTNIIVFFFELVTCVLFLSQRCQDKTITGVWDTGWNWKPPLYLSGKYTCIHRVYRIKDVTFIHTCVYMTNNVLIFESDSSEVLAFEPTSAPQDCLYIKTWNVRKKGYYMTFTVENKYLFFYSIELFNKNVKQYISLQPKPELILRSEFITNDL